MLQLHNSEMTRPRLRSLSSQGSIFRKILSRPGSWLSCQCPQSHGQGPSLSSLPSMKDPESSAGMTTRSTTTALQPQILQRSRNSRVRNAKTERFQIDLLVPSFYATLLKNRRNN